MQADKFIFKISSLNLTAYKMKSGLFIKLLVMLLSGLLLLFSYPSIAQENLTHSLSMHQPLPEDTVAASRFEPEWVPSTAVYLELGGKVLYSINVDFRKKLNFAYSLGVSYFKEDAGSEGQSQSMVFTSVMGYYLTGKRHRIELGGGLCPGIGSEDGFAALAVYGNAGYRIQKKRGLIFRLAFTPFIPVISDDNQFDFIPWGAIALGYSF